MKNSSITTTTSGAVPQRIRQAIKNAADRTGSDFADLLHKAGIESGFNPNAKAKTSSATGLFQFTEQTWLRMIKARGPEYGLNDYADHVQVNSKGKAHVSDPAMRETILDLRQNPELSAEMVCELNHENSLKLRETIGGAIGPTELYLAHFLGAGGAGSFLNAMRANPNIKAADILPNAARANSTLFYGEDGQSRSVVQVYRYLAQKLDQPLANVAALDSRTASPLHPSHVNSETVSLFATMIREQMDAAYLTSMLGVDAAEGESEISVLV